MTDAERDKWRVLYGKAFNDADELQRRIEPVRQSLAWRAANGATENDRAEARALVRILDGKDPADVCCGDPGDCQDCKIDPDFASNFE